MAKIKIISNPYEKRVDFRWFNNGEWKEFSETSKLLNEKYINGFFPFYVKDIVDIIFEDFNAEGESIEIQFEGTGDEYKALKAICSDEKYANISLCRTRKLQNAREILEDVTEIFGNKIRPLIDESAKYNAKIIEASHSFADVSKKIIPICVIGGSYSSGKSTFINALIGAEILPSADKPLTARIHKIERSYDNNKAEISFDYCNKSLRITFNEEKTPLISGFENDEFIDRLNDSITAGEDKLLADRVNEILTIINDEELPETISENIAEIIVISFPFKATPHNVLVKCSTI